MICSTCAYYKKAINGFRCSNPDVTLYKKAPVTCKEYKSRVMESLESWQQIEAKHKEKWDSIGGNGLL